LVDEEDDSLIGFGSDDSTGCLQYPVDARIEISVLEACPLPIEILTDELTFGRDAGKSNAYDGGAGEAIANEVDTFSEYPAHDREPDEGLDIVV